jgi:hypothetical protein
MRRSLQPRHAGLGRERARQHAGAMRAARVPARHAHARDPDVIA